MLTCKLKGTSSAAVDNHSFVRSFPCIVSGCILLRLIVFDISEVSLFLSVILDACEVFQFELVEHSVDCIILLDVLAVVVVHDLIHDLSGD